MTARAEIMMLDALGMNERPCFGGFNYTTAIAEGNAKPMTVETLQNAIDTMNGDSVDQRKRLIRLFGAMGFTVIASGINDNKPVLFLPDEYCEAVKELRDEQEEKVKRES